MQPDDNTEPVDEAQVASNSPAVENTQTTDDTPAAEDVQSVDIKAENKASPDAFTNGTSSSDTSISSPTPAPEIRPGNEPRYQPDANLSHWMEHEERLLKIQADSQMQIAKTLAKSQERLFEKQMGLMREQEKRQMEEKGKREER